MKKLLNKVNKVEQKFIDFIYNNKILIFGIIFTILALTVRYFMLDFKSGDYVNFLSEWFDYLKANGGLRALKNYPGDYNAPYMTIMALLTYLPISKLYTIKFVSIFFDFLVAFAGGMITYNLVEKNKKEFFSLTYVILLFLPNMLMNSAMWGQCDAIYTAFLLLSLLFMIKDKTFMSFLFLGFAFSFKLQFVFILPLYIILYMTKRNFSIFNFFIIPIVNIILCIPAMISGKSFVDCMLVYFNQTQTYNNHLVLNFPNIYNLIPGDVDMLFKVGEITTIAVFAIILFYLMIKKVKWNNEKILNLGVLTLILTTYLLPSMHERYLFAGEILSVIYFIIYRKHGIIAIFINLMALLTYSSYILGLNFIYMQLFSIIYLILVVIYTNKTLIFIGGSNEKQ